VRIPEVAVLLTKIAVFDRRTVGESDVAAWGETLDADMQLQDALDAVAAIRSESADWIMPNHINTRVRAARKARLRDAGIPPIPGGLTYEQEQAWRQLWCTAVKAGRPNPTQEANAAMKITEPPALTDPDRLRQLLSTSKGVPA
jgi:formate dehydrogenase maturation protein FdhE